MAAASTQPQTSQPTYISHCVVIRSDFTWDIFVNSKHIEQRNSIILSALPSNLNNHGTAMKLILILDSAHVCHGYPKREYVEMASSRKGVFRGKSGEVRAQIDSTNPVIMQGKVYQTTIRTVGCALLSNSPLCDQCCSVSHLIIISAES